MGGHYSPRDAFLEGGSQPPLTAGKRLRRNPLLDPEQPFREFSEGCCSAMGVPAASMTRRHPAVLAPPQLQEAAVTSQGLGAPLLAQREDQPFAAPMILALLVFEGDRVSFPSISMDLCFHDFKIWRCPLTPTQRQGMTDSCARFPKDDVSQNHKAQGRGHRGHGRPSVPRPPHPPGPGDHPCGFLLQTSVISGTVRKWNRMTITFPDWLSPTGSPWGTQERHPDRRARG